MNDRIARLEQLSQRLTQAEDDFSTQAAAVRAAAARLAAGQGDARLANVMDDLFKQMRARACLDEGQLLAETSLLLRRRGGSPSPGRVSEAA